MSSNQDPMYSMTSSQNGIFPNMMHSNNFDFVPPDIDPKHQLPNQTKLNGYDANAFRSLSSYNTLRQRHYPGHSVVNPPLRENYYQNPSNDMLGMGSPIQSHTPVALDFGSGQSGHNYKQFHEAYGVQNSTHALGGFNGKAQHINSNKGFPSQFSSGMQISSQTPFGPHIPVNVPSHIPNGSTNVSGANTSQNPSNPSAVPSGNSVAPGQEEICTIFVVGFPDDMQEREFQNMFTFSQGFEAATLKIPNKDNTTYTGNSGRPYGGSDPFNLQGAIPDGGRDGAWPTSDEPSASQFGSNGSAPPRKQIIGFAKFRTRQDAVAAKDHLQGKRIDMEKGAVLKAEMAKKNLHTKRGVGAVSSNNAVTSVAIGNAAAVTGMGPNFGLFQQPVMSGLNNGQDAYTINGVDTLTPLGLSRVNPSLVREPSMGMLRERDEEDARRHFGPLQTRGVRGDDEERERRREKELQRAGVTGFDPFISYPPQSYPEAMRPSLSMNVPSFRSPELNGVLQDEPVGPWDNVATASAQLTPARSSSPNLSTQHLHIENATLMVERQTSSGSISPGGAVGSRCDGVIDPLTMEAEITKSLNGLSLSTNAGDVSPQFPSPVSNASSGGGSRVVDQNPPINTLYVGNLPTGVVEQLEDKLRELFNAQPGYRRLCFRQKNNGPMCFVEFEDVHFATKALHNLQGQTLNGLVKGTGIRLSYSKNPLGVRTPTSTGGGQLQQQQSQSAVDPVQSRIGDDSAQPKPSAMRRDAPTSPQGTGNGTYNSYGNSFLASPPPRFFSSSPSALTTFGAFTSSQSISGLVSRNSAILNLYNPPSSFSPFGLSQPMIPDHHLTSPDEQNSPNSHNVQQHFHRVMSPPVANLEAARAS